MRKMDYALKDSGPIGMLAGLTHTLLLTSAPASRTPGASRTQSRSWLDRFDTWCWNQEVRRREEYLAQATDIADVERRQRALERGLA